MPDKVTLVRQDGTRLDATPEQADKLKLLGYREEGAEENVSRLGEEGKSEYYSDQKGRTAVEGLARGATLGLSDYAFGDEDSRNRVKYNPGTAMATEALGTIAPLLVPGMGELGVGGAMAAGAEITPTAMLVRGAGAAVKGLGLEGGTGRVVRAGLEGAGFGAAQTINHAYLDGTPLTSEAVLHGIGFGTLFGVGLAGVGEAFSAAGNRAALRAAEAKTAQVAPGALKSAAGDSYLAFKTEAGDLAKEIQSATDTVDAVMSGNNRKFSVLRQRAEGAGEAVTAGADRAPVGESLIDSAGAEADFGANARGEVTGDHFPSEKGRRPMTGRGEVTPETVGEGGFSEAVKGQARAQDQGGDFAPGVKGAVEGGATAGGEFPGEVTDAELAGHMKAIKRAYNNIGKAAESKTNAAAKVAAAKTAYQEQVKVVSDRLGVTGGESSIGTAMTELVELKQVKKQLAAFPHSVEAFANMTEARAEKLFAGLEAAKGLSSFPALAKSVDAAAGGLSSALGVEASGIGGLRATWRAAREMSAAERAGVRAAEAAPAPEPPGRLVKGLAKAGGGFAGLKMKAATGSSVLAYEAYATARNLIEGTLSGGKLATVRNAVVGRLNDAAASWLPKLGKVTRAVAPVVEPLAVKLDGTLDSSTKSKEALARARLEEFAAAAPHVNDTLFRAVSSMSVTQPELAPALHAAGVSMFQSLRGMMPADPGVVSGLKSIWNPSPLQIAVMGRQYEVFHNAVGVAERMMSTGSFDPISIKAMQELAPAVYQELRSAMLNRVTTGGLMDKLTYNQQIGLGTMLDIPLHSSMRPEFIASSLMVHAKRRELLPTPSTGANGGGQKSPQDTPGATQGNILGG